MTMLMDALNEWLEALQREDYAPATVTRYAGAIRRFLVWHQRQERRPTRLDDLTPIALAGYRSDLQQSQATSTTNVHVAALRAWCYWLTEQGYLEEDPAQHLKSVGRVDRDAPEPLSNNAVNALLRAARRGRNGKRDHAILQMMLQTGGFGTTPQNGSIQETPQRYGIKSDS